MLLHRERQYKHIYEMLIAYSYTEYTRDLKRTLPEILVDMASWFGVFLGVSILSIVEIIFWLFSNQSQK